MRARPPDQLIRPFNCARRRFGLLDGGPPVFQFKKQHSTNGAELPSGEHTRHPVRQYHGHSVSLGVCICAASHIGARC